MKRLATLVMALMLAFTYEANAAEASSRPHAVSVELLGRGLLYSINYDYLINDDIALGAGFSHQSYSAGNSDATVMIVPVYANYYFTPGNHRWFATAGANVVHASGRVDSEEKVSGSGIGGVLGGGYEYRGDSGFLFRAAPYLMVGKTAGVWAGVSLGYAF